jgi:hypothetical protein
MSYLVAASEFMASAATDLATIGSDLSAAHAAGAASTTRVIPAAADEVSAAIASLFSSHGTAFQALSSQAADFHSQFVQTLNSAEGTYAAAEAANAGLLQTVAQALPVPNVAVSINGFTLLQLGSATATSGTGNLAIAVGAGSQVSSGVDVFTDGGVVPGGRLNVAAAFGHGSEAFAGAGNLNRAVSVGPDSYASAGYGDLNRAVAFSTKAEPVNESGVYTNAEADTGNLNRAVCVGPPGSSAVTGIGSFNLGVTLGANSYCFTGESNHNVGFALGNNDNAYAGGGSVIPSSFDFAAVVGTDSSAYAGSSYTGGNYDLAAAFGSKLAANAVGANLLADIVTPFGTL